MNRLEDLYRVTQQLEGILNKDISGVNREQVIEDVNALVEKRGTYMRELKPPYTEAEEATGQKLLVLNQVIKEKLTYLFEDLKSEIKTTYKEAEEVKCQNILELNQMIQEKLTYLSEDLKSEIKQMKRKKKSNQSYANPNENMSAIDGVFMDLKEKYNSLTKT